MKNKLGLSWYKLINKTINELLNEQDKNHENVDQLISWIEISYPHETNASSKS